MRFYVGFFFLFSFYTIESVGVVVLYTQKQLMINQFLISCLLFLLCSLLVVFVYFFVSLLSSFGSGLSCIYTDRFSNLMAFIYLFIILVLLLLLFSLVFSVFSPTHDDSTLGYFNLFVAFHSHLSSVFSEFLPPYHHRKTMLYTKMDK